jgi:hypothetical protein
MNKNGDKLHIKVYYTLRYAIYVYMVSGQLPRLGESEKPTRGYKTAIARNSVLKQVIITNIEYIQNVQTGSIPF